MVTVIHIHMVCQTQGNCIEEERKALLEIKASHMKAFNSDMDIFLPTWVENDSNTPGNGSSDCCDWERVKCNSTTGHVTELSLGTLRGMPGGNMDNKLWPLNASHFRHFKDLRSLNLSYASLGKEITNTGLERLSSLEVLDLSWNHDIDNNILPSLRTLTSLKILDLSYTSLNGNFLISEFAALENLEMFHVAGCGLSGNFEIQGSKRVSIMRKLITLDLGNNIFNESVITYLNTLPSLTNLDLSYNPMLGPFPAQELALLTNLKELDLTYTGLNAPLNIQACKSLSRLKRLERIHLSGNYFNKSIISCLSSHPSLKFLDLSYSFPFGSSFPVQEYIDFSDLEVLLLSNNGFLGEIPVEAFSSFPHLEVLDLSDNNLVGSIPSTIQSLSSLRDLSFAKNDLNGSLPDPGLCELKNLLELDLSKNRFHGSLPKCLKNLSSLKLLDISSNQFTGIVVPSVIANLTSLEYIDFNHNMFEGSFSFSSFSNHKKLELVRFKSDNDRFEVETEEPIGWIPMFQLKYLELSNCHMKMPKGRVIPEFLIHQHKLRVIDMSENSLKGQFPDWLIKNNTNLVVLILSNNLFGGLPLYGNANMATLDMSGNGMTGTIPDNITKLFPNIQWLNLSMNALSGVIPASIGGLSEVWNLDLSGNMLSGEVPKGLLTNVSSMKLLKLSENKLHGQVLSKNVSWAKLERVYLDSNLFTGEIGAKSNEEKIEFLNTLDISNNFFTGMIPDWVGNMSKVFTLELVVRNNILEGRFPCGVATFRFLDISQNSFYGPIPSCSNFENVKHLLLGSNKFTGSIPKFFRNFTKVLTLDMGNNNLSGTIPKFLGELSTLRILLLRKNNFSGSIPKQLCQLNSVSFIDLSSNSLSGSVPSCLQNITGPNDLAFLEHTVGIYWLDPSFHYKRTVGGSGSTNPDSEIWETQEEVKYTTKRLFLTYKGGILDYMTGLDFSSNKLTGEIPQELGLLTQLHALNLSHNYLTGPIPVSFSNLANMESLDLSSNDLTGKVPSELIKLTSLSTFNVSYNNLSGRLPEMTAQFSTFTEESYEGNPLLCGQPLRKQCTNNSQVTNSSGEEDNEKWYYIDMTCFYASSGSTCVMLLLGFFALLYINPYWRRRWLDWVEDCMFACYYFLYDLLRKPSLP